MPPAQPGMAQLLTPCSAHPGMTVALGLLLLLGGLGLIHRRVCLLCLLACRSLRAAWWRQTGCSAGGAWACCCSPGAERAAPPAADTAGVHCCQDDECSGSKHSSSWQSALKQAGRPALHSAAQHSIHACLASAAHLLPLPLLRVLLLLLLAPLCSGGTT